MEMSRSNKVLLMGLLGFAAGILFAPDKGSTTREKLKARADDLSEKAREKKDQAKEKIESVRNKKDRVKDEADRSANRISNEL